MAQKSAAGKPIGAKYYLLSLTPMPYGATPPFLRVAVNNVERLRGCELAEPSGKHGGWNEIPPHLGLIVWFLLPEGRADEHRHSTAWMAVLNETP